MSNGGAFGGVFPGEYAMDVCFDRMKVSKCSNKLFI